MLRTLDKLALGVKFDLVHLKNMECIVVQKCVVVTGFRFGLGGRPYKQDDTNLGKEGRCSLFGLQRSGADTLLQRFSCANKRIADVFAEELTRFTSLLGDRLAKEFFSFGYDVRMHRLQGCQVVDLRQIRNVDRIDVMLRIAGCS